MGSNEPANERTDGRGYGPRDLFAVSSPRGHNPVWWVRVKG